jgi:hypothetical protein
MSCVPQSIIGFGNFLLGRYESAVEAGCRAVESNPASASCTRGWLHRWSDSDDALDCPAQRVRTRDFANDEVHVGTKNAASGGRVANHGANPVAMRKRFRRHQSSDAAGGANSQHGRGRNDKRWNMRLRSLGGQQTTHR